MNNAIVGSAVDNVEIVKRLYAAFAARNFEQIIASLAPDVEWSEPENPWNPCGGTRRGHAGFLEWTMTGHKSEDVLEMRPAKFVASGDSVAFVGRTRCRAKATGKIYETDFVHLSRFRIRDDRGGLRPGHRHQPQGLAR